MQRISKWIMFISMAVLLVMVFFIGLPYCIINNINLFPRWIYAFLGVALLLFLIGGFIFIYTEIKAVISTLKDILK